MRAIALSVIFDKALESPDEVTPIVFDSLVSDRAKVRQAAVYALLNLHKSKRLNVKQAVDRLVLAIRIHQDGRLAYALGELGPDAAPAVPLLAKLLKTGASSEAARALGKIGEKAAIPVLIETLEAEERSTETRGAAAEALGDLKAEQAIDLLVKAARMPVQPEHAPNEMLVQGALSGLAQLHDERTDAVMRQILKAKPKFEFSEPYRYALAIRYSAKRPLKDGLELVDAIVDPSTFGAYPNNRNMWEAIIGALSDYSARPKELLPILKRFDKHPWSNVTMPAMGLAMKLGPDGVAWVIGLLDSSNPDVRCHAARVLGEAGAKEAIPSLRKALGDKNQYVRSAAAQALGRMQAREAIPDLIAMLGKATEEDVLAKTAEALGELRATEALAALEQQMASAKSKYVREKAEAAVNRIRNPSTTTQPEGPVIQR